jgi:hypothetical protein
VREDCQKPTKNREEEIVAGGEKYVLMSPAASTQETVGLKVDSGCSDNMVPTRYSPRNESQIEITMRAANSKVI